MRIAVGCDHRGYAGRKALLTYLKELGHEVEDFGCQSSAAVDYPDIAEPVAVAVAEQACEVGILLDGNGMGMCMAANKVKGIRAAAAHDVFTAQCARSQHHCNIICIGVEISGGRQIHAIAAAFLSAAPAAGRHGRRVAKLMRIEEKRLQGTPPSAAPDAIETQVPVHLCQLREVVRVAGEVRAVKGGGGPTSCILQRD